MEEYSYIRDNKGRYVFEGPVWVQRIKDELPGYEWRYENGKVVFYKVV